MDKIKFLRGMGMGMVAGISVGMAIAPIMPKKRGHNVIGKALHAAGELADNISEAITR